MHCTLLFFPGSFTATCKYMCNELNSMSIRYVGLEEAKEEEEQEEKE